MPAAAPAPAHTRTKIRQLFTLGPQAKILINGLPDSQNEWTVEGRDSERLTILIRNGDTDIFLDLIQDPINPDTVQLEMFHNRSNGELYRPPLKQRISQAAVRIFTRRKLPLTLHEQVVAAINSENFELDSTTTDAPEEGNENHS